jgi:pimeloyl-ACP methyl ester carboxylesterase
MTCRWSKAPVFAAPFTPGHRADASAYRRMRTASRTAVALLAALGVLCAASELRAQQPQRIMETVTSADGTTIACWRSGSGPPLLLVHGATADHSTTWRYVLPELERYFTVNAMDRRGRGGSGDGPEYSLSREAEDVAAVAYAIGERVSVVGHSYGALAAFEASLLAPSIGRLILYEGVPVRGSELYAPDIIGRLDTLLGDGDMDALLEALFRDIVEMPSEEVELLRTQEAWTTRLRNVHTMPRELRAETGYVFDPARFLRLTAPTLFLVGSESPVRELANARALSAALPDATIAILPGQQHAAMYTAPDEFAEVVRRFLQE